MISPNFDEFDELEYYNIIVTIGTSKTTQFIMIKWLAYRSWEFSNSRGVSKIPICDGKYLFKQVTANNINYIK